MSELHAESRAVREPDLLTPLRAHLSFPVFDRVSRYLGVERDLIQVLEFVSLAGGTMVLPLNLEIYSANWGADLYIANRLLDLRYDRVARITTRKEFAALERSGFKDIDAVLVRGEHRFRFRDFTEASTRLLCFDANLPSLWRVTDRPPEHASAPSTLRIMTQNLPRDLADYGAAFASYRWSDEEVLLIDLLRRLPRQPKYPNPLRPSYQSSGLRPEDSLLLERTLLIFAALRVTLSASPMAQATITEEDYGAVRVLLQNLPLTPIDRKVSPPALKAAEILFESVHEPNYQLALPDQSAEGNRWFTRHDAKDLLDVGYSTARKWLDELENEGVVRSTKAQNNRQRGKQIHYRFQENRTPPFEWKNPFEDLPDLTPMVAKGA